MNLQRQVEIIQDMRRTIHLSILFSLALSLTACQTMPEKAALTNANKGVSSKPAAELSLLNDANILRDTQTPLIWDRLRLLSSLPDCNDYPEAVDWANWYAARPDYLDRVLNRAKPLLPFILDEAEKRSLPAEFALLPAIESAFYPFAYSHGRAAGIWQFIPATARENGLKKNWWYDGRRDLYLSTLAALDHIRELGDRYDEHWLLVLAGYNGGHNRVERQYRELLANNREIDWRNLKLPRETTRYIPKMLGFACLIKHPERYQLALPEFEDKPSIQRVDIGSQMDLALAAELSELSIDDIYRYNPAFNRWATDPDGPHYLLLPPGAAHKLLEKLETLPAEQRVTWRRVEIRPGDSLISLADDHHVTPQMLRDINRIRGNLIRAGDYLLVPESRQQVSQYSLSEKSRIRKRLQNPARQKTLHRVQAGESFWSIARQHGVTVGKLAKWNGMAPGDMLKTGRDLVIYNSKTSLSGNTSLANLGSRLQKVNYRVRNGDSLWSISRKFGVSVQHIRQMNAIKGSLLKPGQTLKIRVDITSTSG